MRKVKRFIEGHRAQLAFLLTLGVVYGGWYLLYEWWLQPDARLDTWMAEQLAAHGGGLLQLAGLDPVIQERVLALPGAAGVLVADACNGFETLGLFVGFVVAFPGKMSRRLLFLPAGLLLIYAANAVRVAALAGLQVHWPLGFEALHSLGTMFFYLVIFLLWVVWVRFGAGETEPSADAQQSGVERPEPVTA